MKNEKINKKKKSKSKNELKNLYNDLVGKNKDFFDEECFGRFYLGDGVYITRNGKFEHD